MDIAERSGHQLTGGQSQQKEGQAKLHQRSTGSEMLAKLRQGRQIHVNRQRANRRNGTQNECQL
ncbi:hypothetical protein D3C80_1313970 [compost metagenome]